MRKYCTFLISNLSLLLLLLLLFSAPCTTIRNLRCQQQWLREAWKLKAIVIGIIIFEGAFTVRLLGVRWLGVTWGITKIHL